MMTANKSPRLVVKLSMATKEQKADLDTLPDTVVSSACYISSLSMFRRLLAEAALIDRIDLQSTDLIHSPVLSSFPQATLYPDFMDALRSSWADKKRTMKKSVKVRSLHIPLCVNVKKKKNERQGYLYPLELEINDKVLCCHVIETITS
ncbi:nephrocystin-1-like [Patiria miniata]|uniref:Uncharacterized protein n=1 Tax=Patiria miniata TaxID=46514 RepID=A0A914BAP7_PATMI|nr:nephrocystin-1-like [Patiria miniata]